MVPDHRASLTVVCLKMVTARSQKQCFDTGTKHQSLRYADSGIPGKIAEEFEVRQISTSDLRKLGFIGFYSAPTHILYSAEDKLESVMCRIKLV